MIVTKKIKISLNISSKEVRRIEWSEIFLIKKTKKINIFLINIKDE